MRYTLRDVIETRYEIGRSFQEKMSERLVLCSAITKFFSPPQTYIFLNLGMHADWITFASIFFIIIAAVLFILGHSVTGVIAVLIFALFDAVDGDMARCTKARTGRTSSYGPIIDSLGADFFYALIPFSVGYFLFSINTEAWFLSSEHILISSAFVSLSFLLYRIVNVKRLRFLADHQQAKEEKTSVRVERNMRSSFVKRSIIRIVKLSRHIAVKGNFFAEPGLILWFSIFLLTKQYEILGVYIIVVLFYNLGFLGINILNAYRTFLSYEENTTKNQ